MNITFVSATVIFCNSPSELVHGSYGIHVVSKDSALKSLNSVAFEVKEVFRLRQIMPQSGSNIGGTEVHLYGKTLNENISYECIFNDAASAVERFDDHHGVCIAPAYPLGPVVFSIRYVDNNITSNSVRFDFVEKVFVAQIVPSKGVFVGGTIVQVRGRNFRDSSNLLCRFGSLMVKAAS